MEPVGVCAGEFPGCNVPIDLSAPTFQLLKREFIVAAVSAVAGHRLLGGLTDVGTGVCMGGAHLLLLECSSTGCPF